MLVFRQLIIVFLLANSASGLGTFRPGGQCPDGCYEAFEANVGCPVLFAGQPDAVISYMLRKGRCKEECDGGGTLAYCCGKIGVSSPNPPPNLPPAHPCPPPSHAVTQIRRSRCAPDPSLIEVVHRGGHVRFKCCLPSAGHPGPI